MQKNSPVFPSGLLNKIDGGADNILVEYFLDDTLVPVKGQKGNAAGFG